MCPRTLKLKGRWLKHLLRFFKCIICILEHSKNEWKEWEVPIYPLFWHAYNLPQCQCHPPQYYACIISMNLCWHIITLSSQFSLEFILGVWQIHNIYHHFSTVWRNFTALKILSGLPICPFLPLAPGNYW